MYCDDMAQYRWRLQAPLEQVFCVGWLDALHTFTTAAPDKAFVDKLHELALHRTRDFDAHVNVVRGIEPCPFCNECITLRDRNSDRWELLGISQLWVPWNDRWFAAPSLIVHYVDAYKYSPPFEFVQAVMALDFSTHFIGEEVNEVLLAEYVRKWPTGF